MTLDGKPYKCFDTLEGLTVFEGNDVKFKVADGTLIEGTIVKIGTKAMTIQREGAYNSENWAFLDIEEGSLQLV